MLYQSVTIICPFSVILKHKCLIMKKKKLKTNLKILKNLKKIQKNHEEPKTSVKCQKMYKTQKIYKKIRKNPEKKPFSSIRLFCYLGRLVFNESSPVHPVSKSRGGTLSITEKKGKTSCV